MSSVEKLNEENKISFLMQLELRSLIVSATALKKKSLFSHNSE